MLRWLFVLAICCSVGTAAARDNGQTKNIPEEIRKWFSEQVSPENGRLCCDIADGYETQEDIRNGEYWVTVEGKWRLVPASRVIHTPNLVGHPVVWYTPGRQNDLGNESEEYILTEKEPIILCFIPGAGL